MSAPYRAPHPAGAEAAAPALPFGFQDTATRECADTVFEELYGAAFPKIYAFIRCQVSSVETAQELVGRIFLKAYKHRLKTPV